LNGNFIAAANLSDEAVPVALYSLEKLIEWKPV
jgi:hypothetical protein